MDWFIVIIFSVHTFTEMNDAHTHFEYHVQPFIGSAWECTSKAESYAFHVNASFSQGEKSSAQGTAVRLGYRRGNARCVLRS